MLFRSLSTETNPSKFGDQLLQYWMRVGLTKGTGAEDVYSYNKAMAYPPHCTLTAFFPRGTKTNEEYYQALLEAIEEQGSAPRTITLTQLKQNFGISSTLDSIQLTSSFLAAVAKAFVQNANLNEGIVKPSDTYHITLRDVAFSGSTKKQRAKLNEIHGFQDSYVAPYIHSSVAWSLTIYSDDGNPPPGNPPPSVKLTTVICSIPI